MHSFLNPQKAQDQNSSNKKIEMILQAFRDQQGEVDYDLLSKNREALEEYRTLLFKCYQAEKIHPKKMDEKLIFFEKSIAPQLIKIAPYIQYTWIGPPAKIPGHDTGGPLKMAKLNSFNPIIFYCLKDHKTHYIEKFKSLKNIHIRTVEECLSIPLKNPKSKAFNVATQMQHIVRTCLKTKGRGSIRDCVTVKDAFSLFILYYEGGYHFDTNVIPTEEKKISFPAHQQLTFPYLKKDKEGHLECWAMYSPTHEHLTVESIFSSFFRKWNQSEQLREQLVRSKSSLESYYLSMGPAIIEPLNEANDRNEINTWETTVDPILAFVDLLDFPLRKTYSNTHIFSMRSKYEPGLFGALGRENDQQLDEIFYLIYFDNILQLKVLLDSKGNPNERIKKVDPKLGLYVGETALHVAIRAKKSTELVKLLLEANANVDLSAIYGKKSITARTLFTKNDEYASLLAEFEKRPSKFKPG